MPTVLVFRVIRAVLVTVFCDTGVLAVFSASPGPTLVHALSDDGASSNSTLPSTCLDFGLFHVFPISGRGGYRVRLWRVPFWTYSRGQPAGRLLASRRWGRWFFPWLRFLVSGIGGRPLFDHCGWSCFQPVWKSRSGVPTDLPARPSPLRVVFPCLLCSCNVSGSLETAEEVCPSPPLGMTVAFAAATLVVPGLQGYLPGCPFVEVSRGTAVFYLFGIYFGPPASRGMAPRFFS